MMKRLLLLLISDAKIRRFYTDSKKKRQIFFNLYGQTNDLWTNRGNNHKRCPKICFFEFYLYLCSEIINRPLHRIMETSDNSIELQIAAVLSDIRQKGFSSVQPFSIGKVEERMIKFALDKAIVLASNELYMSAKQLLHSMRASKKNKGLVVGDADLISFPKNRFQMDLYYDGECFIYTDGLSKFIVHPNYQMKVSREVVKLVNFITATRRTDKKEFNGKRYIKI